MRPPPDTKEQDRFRNLLTLAAQSPFAGERRNALAKAENLAGKYGLTIDEAARAGLKPTAPAPPPRPQSNWPVRPFSSDDAAIMAAKAEREAAFADARRRGLDAAENRPRPRNFSRQPSAPRRRNPVTHARILIQDTALPLTEIVEMTGLDIYQVVGLKLKLRPGVAGSP